MNKVDSILKPLSPDYFGAYLNKDCQLYDIIVWVLNQTGKAEITILTFSISEEFIRKIWMLKKSGLISKISIILDFKAIGKIEALMRFAENVIDEIYLSKTHAKIVLIDSGLYHVSITGSQNCTRGNREESGIITTDDQLFEKLIIEINRLKNCAIHRGGVKQNT